MSRPPTPATSPFHAVVDGVASIGDTHLHVAVDTATRLTPDGLRAALETLARQLPRLRSRFRFRYFGSRWIPDPAPVWSIVEQTVADEAAARAAEDDLFAQPFEPHGTLPVRLVVLHLPDRDRLLLRINHLLADGGGAKNLCYRLAAAFRQAEGAASEGREEAAPPTPRAPHPLWRLLACVRPGRLLPMLYGLFEELSAVRPKRPLAVPMTDAPPGPSRFELLHLGADRVTRLAERWRPAGITINELALAAFTRALAGCFGEANPAGRHAMTVVTTDLRRYEATRRDDVSNYSNLRPLFMGRTPLPKPEEHLRRVVRASRRWKRGLTGLLPGIGVMPALMLLPDAWLRWGVGRGLRLLTGSGPCTALTNIGPIDAERLDFGHGPCLAARITAPIGRPPILLAALTGCAGALDLTITYKEGSLAPSEARRLAEAFDRELAALAPAPRSAQTT